MTCAQAPCYHVFMSNCRECGTEVHIKSGAKRAPLRCLGCATKCRVCGHTVSQGSQSVGYVTRLCWSCKDEESKQLVAKAFSVLGGQCVRCGIVKPVHWDHINEDPKRSPSGKRATGGVIRTEMSEIRNIIATGRSDRLQLLCANCNALKQYEPEEFRKPPTYGPRT